MSIFSLLSKKSREKEFSDVEQAQGKSLNWTPKSELKSSFLICCSKSVVIVAEAARNIPEIILKNAAEFRVLGWIKLRVLSIVRVNIAGMDSTSIPNLAA